MDNLIEDEIVSIEDVGIVETLDIAVSDDNLFIANGILTHNSGFGITEPGLNTIAESIGFAATADVILGIWQEDEDRAAGIIKLGMMKNRLGVNHGTCALKINYSTLTISQDDTVNDTDVSNSAVGALIKASLAN